MTVADQPPAGVELPGIDAHPHARAVLTPALAPGGRPSHAYLFHGPPGTGKRAIARAFAAALLADHPGQVPAIAERIARGAHPDLTWVTPSGASEMLVADVEEPVIAAATRTPFEAGRRVFVIEGVDQMNDQAANRMLKTLEEPPAFVHLLLVTDRPEDVLATISSRCQQVRFDPLPPQAVADRLIERGVEPGRALACARLAMGDARLASWLASPEGDELREAAREFVTAALQGRSAEGRWMALLDGARAAGERAGELAHEELGSSLELLPSKERKRAEREGVTDRRRSERRERTRTLDRGLTLAELWLRDLLCMHEGARELIHAVDRLPQLEAHAEQARESIDPDALPRAIDLLSDTRLTLAQNVSEELALEALSHRLTALSGTLTTP